MSTEISNNNRVVAVGIDGFELTGEHRVPRRGELYFYNGYYGTQNQGAVMLSGGKVGRKFDIVRVEPLPEHFVQVRVEGARGYSGTYLWTYRDPSESLEIGDAVLVPFGYSNEPRYATVQALGRGGWGGAIKDVRSRVLTEELA